VDGSIVAIDALAQSIFNITGNQTAPVLGVSFKGVGFRDAAYSYFNPHGIPSGGDWGLQRHGAVFIQGTENTLIDGCIFERVDGNAVAISGYNRFTTIQNNEFVWIGDSAIISWGYTTGSPDPRDGVDGTAGNEPRYNQIVNNFAHELGIWEKQSSFLFQAKTCDSLIAGNVFFNGMHVCFFFRFSAGLPTVSPMGTCAGPRAGINQNDGYCGNQTLTENLLFNTCRESGDHGPFNR
jgi:hypothetical protein